MENSGITLVGLNTKVERLSKDHERLVARTTALQSVVEVLAWGCWHDRSEVSKRLLESGEKSLAAINTWPEELQQEVVNVWNQAYMQLADPDAGASFIGIRPE